ncbi:MAG: polysaccharide biosynthesis C-terminal domain-containing protein [Planctomycetota bacterium]
MRMTTAVTQPLSETCAEEPSASIDTPEEAHDRGGLLRRVLGRGSWALTDQAFFSASNWLLSVLLANWLASEAEYGAFVVAFGWFLLIATFHNSFVLEPMLVFGPRRFGERLRPYKGALAAMSVTLACVGGVLLAGIAGAYVLLGEGQAAGEILAFAVAAPLILLLWAMRKACYVDLQPRNAALAGAGYMVLMVGGMFAAHGFGVLSIPTAVAVMAVSSILAAGWLALREKVARPSLSIVGEAAGDHWRFGRWALLSGLLTLLPEQIYYLMLPVLEPETGYADAAALRAIQNLFQPFLQLITAVMSLLVPVYVRQTSSADLRRMMRLAMLGLCGLPLVWMLLMGLTHETLVSWLYGGRYTDASGMVWLLGLVPVGYGYIATRAGVLAARERPDQIFLAMAAGGTFTITGGLLFAHWYGLWGIAWAWVISTALGCVVMDLLTRRQLHKHPVGSVDAAKGARGD